MERKYVFSMFGVALAFGLASCSDDDNGPDIGPGSDEPGKIELSVAQQETVEKCNDFSFKLLNVVGRSDEFVNGNVVVSPVSFNYAFSMLANGAEGATRQQMLSALGYDSATLQGMNALNSKMIGELGKLDAKVVLSFANSVWSDPTIAVKDNFVSTLSGYYQAESRKINSTTFIDDLNAWCAAKTNGKITRFMNEGDAIPYFALFNAVYFKGIWNSGCKFDGKNTKEGYFNDSEGTRSVAKFMKQAGELTYSETATMEKCELPFGNTSFRASFILPKEGVSIEQALDNLAAGDWKILNEKYIPEAPYGWVEVKLSLPKFKIESEVEFMRYMTALGMPDVLGPDADYSNIADTGVEINKVKQKATFEITEEGAEASAVTGIWGETAPSPAQIKHVDMTFDRPFIYVVYEHSTGAILFAGCVNTFSK